jgi:hypothetical protein
MSGGSSTTALTGGVYLLINHIGETWEPTAAVGTVGAFTRIRHLKGLITLATTGTEIYVASLEMWKGNKILDPTVGGDLPANAQEIFFRQPIAILGDMVQRYTFSWPRVSIDQDQRFSVYLRTHSTSGNTSLGYAFQYKQQTSLQ